MGREQAEDRKQTLFSDFLFNMHCQITQIPVRPAICSLHTRLRPPIRSFIYSKLQQFFLAANRCCAWIKGVTGSDLIYSMCYNKAASDTATTSLLHAPIPESELPFTRQAVL